MKTDIHFIGLGNAGLTILEYFISKGVSGKYYNINKSIEMNHNQNIRHIACPDVEDKIGQRSKELENPDLSSLNLLTEDIKQLFEDDVIYVLLAGLGKYMGTNLALQVAEYLHQQGKQFYLICSSPFSFEGHPTNVYAERALKKLEAFTKPVSFSLNRITETHGNMKLNEAYLKIGDECHKILLKKIEM